ncbi:phage infection protein [Bacillus sp. FJAT-27264]|uniref:YhgE/Pip domain-containing protein n=1 Tax=Paenibacillus sp. (strain DSM 101736 / FJAT-27264) TaxID=1850362 RepID=UPI000807AA21|nr:YhgE/Pip domain-containing protein [Bacillus sp. FJAT-27264]OBZ11728.1 phage infection protein [Bacillus sp. FJAT-27264]
MAGIIRIYRSDWRNVFKVPTAVLLIAALVVLPSIYDWVNVAAVWDPYSNTSGIKIAVASLDEGASVDNKSFNIGEEVLESLHHNKSLGWTFVDAEQARHGVERGDYYASVVISKDFSSKMAGILEGRLNKPEIEYTVNEKINAIAPKITAKGASSITAQISEHFTATLSETVLTALGRIDRQFQSELPVIRRVEKGLFLLEDNLPEIEAAGKTVLKIHQEWPQIHQSAERLATLEQKLPEVEKAGTAIETVDDHWPQINEAAGHLMELESKLPELERAAKLVSGLDEHFDDVAGVLDKASVDMENGRKIVDAAIKALPQADKIAAAGSAFGQQLQQFIEKNNAALAAIPPVIKQNLYLLEQTENAVSQLAEGLKAGTMETAAALSALNANLTRLAAGKNVLDRTISLLTTLDELSSGNALAAEIQALDGVRDQLADQSALAGSLASALEAGGEPDAGKMQQLSTGVGQGSTALGRLISRFESHTLPAIQSALQPLTAAAQDAATRLQQVPERLPALAAILQDAAAAIQYGQEGLMALQKDLPAIRAAVHTSAAGIADKMQRFSTFVRDVLPRIQQGLPAAGQRIHEAADFARHDLPAVEQKVRKAADLIRTGLPKADKGVERAAELVRDDLPLLEAAIRKAAATIRQIKQEVNLEQIADLLGGDIKSKSDFLANPVILKENKLYPIPNYGSAMTPFYVVLSIWVGGTLLISLLRTSVETGGIVYKSYQLYFGRLLTFLTVGILQALVAALGNIFILNCYVADKLWFILFAMLISIVFVTIVFTFVSVFGNIGKGIAIVFMVLQFSSSGGTFPISTTGPFFQALNPFMPFTYAISLLREAVGGILPEVAIRDALYLVGFGLIALVLALTLKKPLERFIHKAAEQAEKSKLIS